MSEMVERVARLLREARGCEAPSIMQGDVIPCPFCRWGSDEDGKPHEETGCFWWAERIIEAMREPTEAMLEAGAEGSGEDSRGVATGAWNAMIEAALK